MFITKLLLRYAIVPGFIDTHIHYPQVDMVAANSAFLLADKTPFVIN